MKKKMDLQKVFRCIFLALAIVSMLIAIAGKVSAEEFFTPEDVFDFYGDNYKTDYLISEFNRVNSEYSRWIIVTNASQNKFLVYWFPKNDKISYYIFSQFNDLNSTTLNQQNISFYIFGGGYGGRCYFGTKDPTASVSNIDGYCLYVDSNRKIFAHLVPTSSSWSSYSDGSYVLSGSQRSWLDNNTGIYYNTSDYYSYSISVGPYDGYGSYFSNFSGNIGTRNSSGYAESFIKTVEQNYFPPSVNPKFKVYSTFGSAGISDPILHIEYNDTLFDAGYTYTSFTQYDLTFDVDGESVVYSADSDQFPDDFFQAEYNSGFRVPYEYIYEMLSDQLFNFSEASSVKLVQVDMTATAYPDLAHLGTPQTKTAATLCSLNLKGYDVAPEYDYDSPAEITDKTLVYDQVVDSNDYINHSGQFNPANIPSWADVVTVIVYNDPVGQNFNAPFSCDLYINDDILKSFSFSGYTDPNYIITTSTGTVIDYDHLVLNKAYLSEFIIVSKLLDSADCVHFISGDYDGNGTWTTYDSYLFINQSYYQKLTIKGIGNLQSAVEAGSYYTKGLYTYVYNKLNSMADNSITYYSNSFTALQEQKSILGSINSGLLSVKDTISSGTDRIVNAIGSISSGGSSYSLPSLSNEIQRLFIPSLTWDSIDFDEYIDSLGVLGLPFTSTNDVLMATRANYSPDFEIHINDFKPTILGETFTVFEDQDYSFNPRRIFSLEIWTTLQYLNAFALILGEAWFTYCHIFRREKNDC